ncbi:hypothetical protein C8Q74DRAFT_1222725 [Fomes fomentarius]|nr:hypothetical protein C8Q74DRAFT_1222725 [Fomes fomentarius]
MDRIILDMLRLSVHEVLASGTVDTMRQMSVFKSSMSTQVDSWWVTDTPHEDPVYWATLPLEDLGIVLSGCLSKRGRYQSPAIFCSQNKAQQSKAAVPVKVKPTGKAPPRTPKPKPRAKKVVKGKQDGLSTPDADTGIEAPAQATEPAKCKKGAAEGAKEKPACTAAVLKPQVAAGIQGTQDTVHTATIGYARFNTVDPLRADVHLQFGQFNPRPVNKSVIKKLVEDFYASGRDPQREALAVLVDPAWLEPDSVVQNPALPWEELPDMQFTAAVAGQTIQILTGQHRSVAGKTWRAAMTAECTTQEKKLAKAAEKQQTEQVKQVEKNVAELTAAIKGATMWLVRFLNPELMSIPLRIQVARNPKAPWLETTEAKCMMMTLPLLDAKVEEWMIANPGEPRLIPGTMMWVHKIVGGVIPEPQRCSDKYPILFHSEPPHRLLRQMDGLEAFRGKYVIPMNVLHQALSLPTRSSTTTSLVGSCFAEILSCSFDMLGIFSRMSPLVNIPDYTTICVEYAPGETLEDASGNTVQGPLWNQIAPTLLPFLNMMRSCEGLDLIISEQVWKENSFSSMIEDQATWNMAQTAQEELVDEQYLNTLSTISLQGEHVVSFCMPDLVDAFDAVYCTHVRPYMSMHFLMIMDETWKEAMGKYCESLKKALLQLWKAQLNQINSEKHHDNTEAAVEHDCLCLALRYAPAKLKLITMAMHAGFMLDAPFPSPSYHDDLLAALKEYEHGIRWSPCTPDHGVPGLSTSVFARSHVVFDPCTYILAVMKGSELFAPNGDISRKFYNWLFNNMRVVDAVLRQCTTKEMLSMWEITSNKWHTLVEKFGAAKHKAVEAPGWQHFEKKIGTSLKLTDHDHNQINGMRHWLAGVMNPWLFPTAKVLAQWQLAPNNTVHLTDLQAWLHHCNISLLDMDPLTKTLPDIPPTNFRCYPALRMIYRTWGLRNEHWKTKHVGGDVLSALAQIGLNNQVATTGRVLQTKDGPALQTSFMDLLASISMPMGDMFMRSSVRQKAAAPRWCNWDDGLLEKLVFDSQTMYGVLDVAVSSSERTKAVVRQAQYLKEFAQLGKWLEKSTIARCAPT